jgi:alpha-galactosidase
MRDALYAAGRPIVFSLCEWGLSKPWIWAEEVGHMYRITGDIRDNWNIPDAKEGYVWGGGVIINLDMQEGLHHFAGPDHWNDPDMLVVGLGGLTYEESKSHISLWSILAAPLMAGNNLLEMDKKTLEILNNKEVIDVDQDPLGIVAHKAIDEGQFEVFDKRLSDDKISYCFFNRKDKSFHLSFDWVKLNLEKEYSIRDLWSHKSLGTTRKILNKEIPAQGYYMSGLNRSNNSYLILINVLLRS